MDTMEKIESENSRLGKIAGRVNWPVIISGIASLILKFSTGTLLPSWQIVLKGMKLDLDTGFRGMYMFPIRGYFDTVAVENDIKQGTFNTLTGYSYTLAEPGRKKISFD